MSLISRSFAMLVVALLVFPGASFAQETPVSTDDSLLLCQAFLNPASVQIAVQSTVPATIAGAETFFAGELINTTNTALQDATLFARTFKQIGEEIDPADPVIDQVVVETDLKLAADEVQPFEHSWNVPLTAPSGTYYVEFYLVLNGTYPVSGVPFSDTRSLNIASVDVAGEATQVAPVVFDSGRTAINGTSYEVNSVVPVDFDESQTVTAVLSNSSDETKLLPVEWRQYIHTAISEDELINTDVRLVSVEAGDTVEISYTLQPHVGVQGQVVGLVQDQQAKSYIDVRYGQTDTAEGQVLFTGLTEESDTAYSVYACAVNGDLNTEGTLSIVAVDTNGNEVFSGSETVGAGLFLLNEVFEVTSGMEIASLTATYEQDGLVVDSADVQLRELVEETSTEEVSGGGEVKEALSVSQLIMLTVGVVVLVLIVIIVFVLLRKKGETNVTKSVKEDDVDDNDSDASTPLVPALFLCAMLSFGFAGTVEAAPPSVNLSASPASITSGGSSNLSWNTSGASACTLTPGGSVSTNGSQTVSPSVTTNYSLSCSAAAPSCSGLGAGSCSATAGCLWVGPFECGFGLPTSCGFCMFGGPYETSADSVTVSVAAAAANRAPSISISGPTSGTQGSNAALTFRGTDPDGDQVRYLIDWNSDGVTDTITPWVNSGTNRVISYSLSSIGTVNLRARSEDRNGAFSGWDTHSIVVTAPPASGNVNGSGCTIAAGNSTCIGNVSWSLTGSCQYIFNHGTGVVVSSGVNSGSSNLNLRYGSNRVVGITQCLPAPRNYYTAFNIDDTILNATCALGSTWNGSICAPNTPPPATGSISGSGCTIPAGSGTCNGSFSWNFSNANNPRVVNQTDGNMSHHIGLTSGTNEPVPLTYGNNTIVMYDWTQLLDTAVVNANCAAGSSWNGTSCYVAAVTPSNNPPNPPTITGNSNGTLGVAGPALTFRATDPDGDDIRYDIDFDGNWSVDRSLPQFSGTGYTNSGSAQTYSNTWTSAGLFTVRARAVDDQGAASAWATYDVSISAPAAPPSGFGATPTTINVGESVTFSLNCSSRINGFNTTSFVLDGLDTGSAYRGTPGGNESYTHTFNSAGTYRVDAECIAGDPSVLPPAGNINETAYIGNVTIRVLPSSPSATISGTGCTILAGDSTCTGYASWDIQNSVAFNVWNDTTGQSYSTAGYGLNEPVTLEYGNNEVWAMGTQSPPITPSSDLPLGITNLVASCVSGTTWNGSSCASTAITACAPNGSLYNWNGVNWDDLSASAPNWTPADVGMGSFTTPPGTWSAPVSLGLGVTWESQNNLRCGSTPPPAAPVVTLTINGSGGPITVDAGDPIRIQWSSTDTTSCTASGNGWNGSVALSGDTGSSVLASGSGAQTYRLSCSGPSGTTFDDVSVTVNPPAAGDAGMCFGNQVVNAAGTACGINGDYVSSLNACTEGPGDQSGVIDTNDTLVCYLPMTPPTPAPTINLEVLNPNTAAWQTGNVSIDDGDTLRFRWSTTDATSCSGIGSGTNNWPSGVVVSAPSAGSTNVPFTLTCTGPGGTDAETINVTVQNLPDLRDTAGGKILDGTFDTTNLVYNGVAIDFLTRNNSVADISSNIEWRVLRNGSLADSGTLSPLNAGDFSPRETVILNGVPMGDSAIDVEIDYNDLIREIDNNNNDLPFTLRMDAPDPGLDMNLVPSDIVRTGQSVDIFWEVDTPYATLDCSINGPGLSTPIDPMPGSGSEIALDITAKSEYIFSCTETTTGSVFSVTQTVETTGSVEEI